MSRTQFVGRESKSINRRMLSLSRCQTLIAPILLVWGLICAAVPKAASQGDLENGITTSKAGAATVESVVVTKTPNPSCAPPTPQASFYTYDNVYLWFYVSNATAGDFAVAKWTTADSTAVPDTIWQAVPFTGNVCFFTPNPAVPLALYPSVGPWRVEIYINGEKLGQASFVVDEEPPSPLCTRPKIPSPSSGVMGLNKWSMAYSVTNDDGLQLNEVYLGKRRMATQMSLPYFLLQTSSIPAYRCELKSDSSSAACRSRLVDFKAATTAQAATIEATYEVDHMGGGSCLVITQTYDFLAEMLSGCEPTNDLSPCALFFPKVRYEFRPGPGETLTTISTAQRLHFAPTSGKRNLENSGSVAIFRDCDQEPGHIIECGPKNAFTEVLDKNPLPAEILATAIVDGRGGKALETWDNIHQTYNSRVLEPRIENFGGVGGCPECVHIHWRWGWGASFRYGGKWGWGRPLIPTDSKQKVDVGIVKYRQGEEDPFLFTDLLRIKEVFGGPSPRNEKEGLVVWYSATANSLSDTFFLHGGFFSSIVK